MLRILFGGLIILILNLGYSKAQGIVVQPSQAAIEGQQRPGLATQIVLDKKFVERCWIKKMKELGRPDVVKGGAYVIRNLNLTSVRTEPLDLYSLVETTQEGIIVFWAIDLGSHFLSDTCIEYQATSRLLHEFAVQVYREDMNLQIAEADKTLDATVRQHDKQVEQGSKISQNINKNKLEKLKLEKALNDNAADLVRLKNDSISNRLQQGSLLEEIEKIRKVVEEKRAKLQKIE